LKTQEEKNKDSRRKYEKTEKGRLRQKRYFNSTKGRKMLNKAQNKYNAKLRRQVLELLGGKCSNPNCSILGGCRDVRCLQIDHIKGGGAKERSNGITSSTLLLKILKDPEKAKTEYQLLCANCNWIKRYENKEFKKAGV